VDGAVTALHQIPNGVIQGVYEIPKRYAEIAEKGAVEKVVRLGVWLKACQHQNTSNARLVHGAIN
jgi:hypothetical protein